MKSSKLILFMQKKWDRRFLKMIAPALRRTAGRLLHWRPPSPDPRDEPDQWKQKALDDFTDWLAALPASRPDGEPGTQACDLYTLLVEFAALRQEIKLQTRQQRTTLRTHENLSDQLQTISTQFNERIARLDQIHDHTWRRNFEATTVLPFLDVRDSLVRGMAAAKAVTGTRALWRRPPKGIDAVVEGYAMALRRFDRSLDRLGIQPIETIGHPFNTACMRAVEKRHVANQKPGIVLEEALGGFTRAGEVIRTAEVVVNGK